MRDNLNGMRPIGSLLAPRVPGSGSPTSAKSNAASYSRIKQAWAEQVAADQSLSGIALRVALVLPRWLNRESLVAWPAQSTVAEAINSTVRSVRAAFRKLEERGHLVCLNEFRGGRKPNHYRIVVNAEVIAPHPHNPATLEPGREEHINRGDRMIPTALTGRNDQVSTDALVRGTPEKTLEETKSSDSASSASAEGQIGPRVSRERANAILREIMGDGGVSETGYLRRE